MSRFFKSALFPILIVIVLAFFAQRIIGNQSTKHPPSFGRFLTQLDQGEVAKADLKTKDNTIQVTPSQTAADKHKYETGYPDNYEPILINKLQVALKNHQVQDYDVEGKKSNGWL